MPEQLSLFPKEYYLDKIKEACKDKERIGNVVKIDKIIRISNLLNLYFYDRE